MKKTIAWVLCAVFLAATLCACNNVSGSGVYNRPGDGSEPDGMIPDVEDGLVNDRDGMIEDGDNYRDRVGTDRNDTTASGNGYTGSTANGSTAGNGTTNGTAGSASNANGTTGGNSTGSSAKAPSATARP